MKLPFKNEYINRAIIVTVFNIALSIYSILIFSIYDYVANDLQLQSSLKNFFSSILLFTTMPFIGSWLLFITKKVYLLFIYHIGDILFAFYVLYPQKILLYPSILINLIRSIFIILFVYIGGKFC